MSKLETVRVWAENSLRHARRRLEGSEEHTHDWSFNLGAEDELEDLITLLDQPESND